MFETNVSSTFFCEITFIKFFCKLCTFPLPPPNSLSNYVIFNSDININDPVLKYHVNDLKHILILNIISGKEQDLMQIRMRFTMMRLKSVVRYYYGRRYM